MDVETKELVAAENNVKELLESIIHVPSIGSVHIQWMKISFPLWVSSHKNIYYCLDDLFTSTLGQYNHHKYKNNIERKAFQLY